MIQTELNFGGVQETSRIAYHENKEGKKRQMDRIVSLVRSGKNNLLELARETGLPQSTVAGRVNDAVNGYPPVLKYDGEVEFMGRRRKRIVVV
jgi:hypothetical protein